MNISIDRNAGLILLSRPFRQAKPSRLTLFSIGFLIPDISFFMFLPRNSFLRGLCSDTSVRRNFQYRHLYAKSLQIVTNNLLVSQTFEQLLACHVVITKSCRCVFFYSHYRLASDLIEMPWIGTVQGDSLGM